MRIDPDPCVCVCEPCVLLNLDGGHTSAACSERCEYPDEDLEDKMEIFSGLCWICGIKPGEVKQTYSALPWIVLFFCIECDAKERKINAAVKSTLA